jgi:hypothetical protein
VAAVPGPIGIPLIPEFSAILQESAEVISRA